LADPLEPSDWNPPHGPSLCSACHLSKRQRCYSRTLNGQVNKRRGGNCSGARLKQYKCGRRHGLFAAINPLLVVAGFVVGMLVGLGPGVGGGSLMTPIIVLLFGVQATTAVGTRPPLYAARNQETGRTADAWTSKENGGTGASRAARGRARSRQQYLRLVRAPYLGHQGQTPSPGPDHQPALGIAIVMTRGLRPVASVAAVCWDRDAAGGAVPWVGPRQLTTFAGSWLGGVS